MIEIVIEIGRWGSDKVSATRAAGSYPGSSASGPAVGIGSGGAGDLHFRSRAIECIMERQCLHHRCA